MMRLVFSLFTFVLLAACAATAPDDGAIGGVTATMTDTNTATTPSATGKSSTAAKQPAIPNNDHPAISDTQNFAAVTERVTAAADKARLQALRKEFKVIAPTPLPKRGNTANVAAFALKSTNKVGVKKYARLNPLREVFAKGNCRRYQIPDDAQEAFLKAGGPERDPLNLDPDGDGYACSWTPNEYRKLLK